jgi:hypothetical protein
MKSTASFSVDPRFLRFTVKVTPPASMLCENSWTTLEMPRRGWPYRTFFPQLIGKAHLDKLLTSG